MYYGSGDMTAELGELGDDAFVGPPAPAGSTVNQGGNTIVPSGYGAGTDWGAIAKTAGSASQDILTKYMQLQAAKAGIQQQTVAQAAAAKLAASQAALNAKLAAAGAGKGGSTDYTMWIIGGVALLALVGGGAFLMKRSKANNPGGKGWKTIGA
jgi:hypothetical protein